MSAANWVVALDLKGFGDSEKPFLASNYKDELILEVILPKNKEKNNNMYAALPALQRHYTENSKQTFPEKELRGGLSPSSYNHVSVCDLYIPTIGLPILLQENRWTDRGKICKLLTYTYECRNWD